MESAVRLQPQKDGRFSDARQTLGVRGYARIEHGFERRQILKYCGLRASIDVLSISWAIHQVTSLGWLRRLPATLGLRPLLSYQSIRSMSATKSKWRSRLRSGKECCRQSAAIQTSLEGMGVPACLSLERRMA